MDESMSKSFWVIKRHCHEGALLWFIQIQNKTYTLFTDAPKYAWSSVLTQEHTTVIDGNT